MISLSVKSNLFCIKSRFEWTLRKPEKAACDVRSNRIKVGPSINSGLYRIRYIEGVLPPQKEQRGKADFGNVKNFLFKGTALLRILFWKEQG